MKQSSILITGCGSGLGNHWLKLLLTSGNKVIGLSRSPEDLDVDLKNHPQLTLVKCNIGKSSEIQAIDEKILSQVEVIINNAGFGQVGPVASQKRSDLEKQFSINLFGLIELTNRVIPYMRTFPSPKLIMAGSSAGCITSPFNGVYAASKHALEAITDAYRFELAPLGIETTNLQLGKLRTSYGSRAKSVAKQYQDTLSAEWKKGFSSFNEGLDKQDGQRVEELDEKLLSLLNSSKLKSRYIWDHHTKIILLLRRFLPRCIYEWLLLRRSGL